jgi:hypothetical protein
VCTAGKLESALSLANQKNSEAEEVRSKMVQAHKDKQSAMRAEATLVAEEIERLKKAAEVRTRGAGRTNSLTLSHTRSRDTAPHVLPRHISQRQEVREQHAAEVQHSQQMSCSFDHQCCMHAMLLAGRAAHTTLAYRSLTTNPHAGDHACEDSSHHQPPCG